MYGEDDYLDQAYEDRTHLDDEHDPHDSFWNNPDEDEDFEEEEDDWEKENWQWTNEEPAEEETQE